ncbi:MAG: C40 family peptidase [Chitinophagales bacterium]
MRYIFPVLSIAVFVFIIGFSPKKSTNKVNDDVTVTAGTVNIKPLEKDLTKSVEKDIVKPAEETAQATSFVKYAKTLIGTPYLYGSVDPNKGLDCSGFVNCVSNHFGMKVPRSSVDFTDFGTTIETENAKPGDLILFTGTDPSRHVVGHIGIVTENEDGQIEFVHSSSGKAKGVTLSDLDRHYQERLVKVIRIFPMAS